MAHAARVLRDYYRDSVALMQLSAQLAARPGIAQAAAVMATERNLSQLREAGLLAGDVVAGPNDLLIALEGEAPALEAALDDAARTLDRPPPAAGGGVTAIAPRSLEMGLAAQPAANLALISVPGDYAAAEAMKALRLGLNVMLFSDNVALGDEVALKRAAAARGLLVMGPDCGTAILNGVPLGFANAVRRGPVGLVGASGTGLQLLTCLIDRLGGGVSHAIGTGGRDLSAGVGGMTMLHGVDALAADAATRVIVLVSKPPAPEVAARVLDRAQASGKPVVVCFLGADPAPVAARGLTPAATLEDAAVAAVRRAGIAAEMPLVPAVAPRGERGFVRGLYSGGTFCYEAALLLGDMLPDVFANTPVGRVRPLGEGRGHTLVDLGEDEFTRGRPHPMIDHRLRLDRIAAASRDPETAVILLDVVLGYGAHPDPAAVLAPAIAAVRPGISVVGFVCGTAADPQNLPRQEAILREAGTMLAPSNASAVRLAARLAAGRA